MTPFEEGPRLEKQYEVDERKARENLRSAKDFSITFESKLAEALQGKALNASALHYALTSGAGSAESAGDYLDDVASYLEAYREGNATTNAEIRALAGELKEVRGRIEADWKAEGKTPEGYDPEKALIEIRGLFSRLSNLNI